jgi:hypothetical protein
MQCLRWHARSTPSSPSTATAAPRGTSAAGPPPGARALDPRFRARATQQTLAEPPSLQQRPDGPAAQMGKHEHVPETLPEVLSTYFLNPGIASVHATLLLVAAWRSARPLGAADAAAALLAVSFWLLQEWAIHAKLLHSSFDWPGKDIHEGHHALPYHHGKCCACRRGWPQAAARTAAASRCIGLAGHGCMLRQVHIRRSRNPHPACAAAVSLDPLWLMVAFMGAAAAASCLLLGPTPLAASAFLGYSAAGGRHVCRQAGRAAAAAATARGRRTSSSEQA